MKFSLIPTVAGVLEALADRERSTTSRLRLSRYRELATNRIMELLGESAETANPDKPPKLWPCSLDAVELDHSDDKHSLASDTLDPAKLDWDRQHKIELPVERFGFRTVETGKIISDGKRQEPCRTKLHWAWQAEIELWPTGERETVEPTYTDRKPPTVRPVPAVNRKGDRLTPPPAIVAEQAAAAVVRLLEAPAPERMTWEEDAESTLSQVGSLPAVGRYRKLRYDNDIVIVERISHDTCRVTAIA